VTANLARGADGRWTALHAAPLYAHARTAGYLYQAALREQLGIELGVRFTAPVRGAGEIIGVPHAVIEHFSTRRIEIREAMSERGTTGAAAARVAALATRRAKQHTVPTSSIYERWRARAAEHGLDASRVRQLVGHEVIGTTAEQLRFLVTSMAGETGLTAYASSFTRREVLREWASGHAAGASVARLEAPADRWLDSELVVRLDEGRFSTPQMLEAERGLMDYAQRQIGVDIAIADDDALDRALSARPYLAAEQRAMVTALTTSGHGVQVVLAKAGSGKTTTLDAARDAWERSGVEVQGAALGSYAALELRDSGVDATTIAALLRDMQQHSLPRDSVLIIDEAGMVGTRTLQRLASHAAAREVKLVLVGDDHQLPEIDAGGAFRGVAARLGAVRLDDNRRQVDPEDRRALDAYRDGRPDELIASLHRRDRLTIGGTIGETRSALVADWWAGANAVGVADATMIALRRSDVRELNQLAREQMRAAGRLGPTELVLDGRAAFAVGDHIVTRRPDRRLGVANGTRAEITRLEADGALRLREHGGRELSLPARYVQNVNRGQPAIEHGYAVTAHRLQGGTTDRSYVLGSDDLYREWGYVAFSRHREESRFYVTVQEVPEHALPDAIESQVDPLEPILRGLRRSHAQELAIDIEAGGELRRAPSDALFTEAAHLREVLTADPTAPRTSAEHAGETTRLVAIESELTHRRDVARSEAVRLVTVSPPRYVTDVLGQRPDEPSRRRAWDRGARTIERYRVDHGRTLTAADRGLGTRPSEAGDRRAFFAADRQVRLAQSALDRADRPIDLGIDR
jgi:hypothetical protein